MATEIATLEKVREAVAVLRRRSVAATAARVIEFIGGGSKGTVLAHLRSLRNPSGEADPLPGGIHEIAKEALEQIYQLGARNEAEKFRATFERLSTDLQETDAQILELSEENARLLVQVDAAMHRAEEAIAANAAAEENYRTSEANRKELERQLHEERLRQNEEMVMSIGRIEAAIQAASKQSQNPAARQRGTISLPDGKGST